MVWGYHLPRGPPKINFLNDLVLGVSVFLISVDIEKTNILLWFKGTTPLEDPPN